ncbi:hypothetical protein PVAND_003092 [Polypedilum vanderplanki]|uniref:Deoxyribodipyrimidine photo-lyase n=1 Tax=Polypedilum vanderplanki TaxID=319348 RepID=A0A9J6BUP2_POLVA|nr:hypothetical protein PVAND_003092 [Polypedilum vanderplanki]
MKRKVSTDESKTSKKSKVEEFIEEIHNNRIEFAENIQKFKFNRNRLRFINELEKLSDDKNGICYWMSRDQRVQDNWALLFSQKLALKNHWPLHVIFCITDDYLNSSLRNYKFLLDGLQEVSKELEDLNINFHLLNGDHSVEIPNFLKKFNIGCLVCDLSVLRKHREWVEKIKIALPPSTGFIQIDSHNVVPVWEASDKQEYHARTMRSKIYDKLGDYLTEFPPVVRHPYDADKNSQAKSIDWKAALKFIKSEAYAVTDFDFYKPGYKNGMIMLDTFIKERLAIYEKRQDPLGDGISNLSIYFRYGHIAPQRAVLEVAKFRKTQSENVEMFIDEVIMRRELCENFCWYNENYDNFNGLPDWGQKTLNDHRKDKREWNYTLEELENAKTHDDLWNSAQLQMIKEGKMHRWLRMYWGKKILEWTKTPEEAIEFSIILNDRYNLDGREPGGYAGCLWSIGGLHDVAFAERVIFGKVRFMNYAGCKRKFKVDEYIARYGGIVHNKKK